MNLSLLKQRPHTRIETIWRKKRSLQNSLEDFRFTAHTKELRELNRNQAIETLEFLFWKDMAYESEYLPRKAARSLAVTLIRTLSEANSRYFSNGHWFEKEGKLSFSWNPCTEAPFDGGIIIQNKDCYICIWFEDKN